MRQASAWPVTFFSTLSVAFGYDGYGLRFSTYVSTARCKTVRACLPCLLMKMLLLLCYCAILMLKCVACCCCSHLCLPRDPHPIPLPLLLHHCTPTPPPWLHRPTHSTVPLRCTAVPLSPRTTVPTPVNTHLHLSPSHHAAARLSRY